MNSQDRKKLIDDQLQNVSNAIGITLEREYLTRTHDFEVSIRLPELPKPYGLAIHIGDDYLTWRIELTLDNFSRVMLNKMTKFYEQRKAAFETYLELAEKRNNKFILRINDHPIQGSKELEDWDEFNLIISKSYSTQEEEFSSLNYSLLDFFCLILILLVDETEWNSDQKNDEFHGDFEGNQSRIEVTKYERSRYNRALCLAFYGFKCRGCGQILEEKYGPLGANVIHVHHIVPVSQMGGSYRLDPIKDLIPLCPNCHNIVHRVNPPISIDELKELTGFEID